MLLILEFALLLGWAVRSFDLDHYNLRKTCRTIVIATRYQERRDSTKLSGLRNCDAIALVAPRQRPALTQEANTGFKVPFEPQLRDVYVPRISNIGLLEIRVRPSATLPSNNRRIPLRPCVPITTKSAGHCVASSSMTS